MNISPSQTKEEKKFIWSSSITHRLYQSRQLSCPLLALPGKVLDSYVGLMQTEVMLSSMNMNRLGCTLVNNCLAACFFCLTCCCFSSSSCFLTWRLMSGDWKCHSQHGLFLDLLNMVWLYEMNNYLVCCLFCLSCWAFTDSRVYPCPSCESSLQL